MSTVETATAGSGATYSSAAAIFVPTDAIKPSPTNPRKHFDKAALEELSESVKKHGVLSPILVRQRPGHPEEYELVAGERRWRAARRAALEQVPARVLELTDAEVLELQVIENLQREDLHPLEEAEGYEQLLKLNAYAGGVEDLAAKLGKSKAYVYARLKLTALCPEARKAFYDGKLNPSTALLVARIPVSTLQAQAVKEITDDRFHGGPMSVREAAEHIQQDYMLRLAEAPFKTDDTTLVPTAGACSACPKRTGNQRELFADVKGADVCTDPVCFKSKKDAWIAITVAAAREEGRTVIDGKAAAKIIEHGHIGYNSGYVDLSKANYEDGKQRSYRQILGAKCPPPVLVVDPQTGDLKETLPQKELTRALKEAGFKTGSSSTHSSGGSSYNNKQEREAAEKRKAKAQDMQRVCTAVHAAIRDKVKLLGHSLIASLIVRACRGDIQIPVAVIKLWGGFDIKRLERLASNNEGLIYGDVIAAELEKRLDKATDVDLARIAFDLIVADELTVEQHQVGNHKTPQLEAFTKLYKIDRGAVEKQVAAELAAEKAPASEKAAAAPPPAVPAKKGSKAKLTLGAKTAKASSKPAKKKASKK